MHSFKIKPPSILNMGDIGTGKTYALATAARAGLDLRCLFTDPGGEESLIDAAVKMQLPFDHIHWNYVAPASTDWATMRNVAEQITYKDYETLSKEKSGIQKAKYRQVYELLALMTNFKCAHCGQEFGPVDSWGENVAFAFDGFSGLNQMARDLTVGAKPSPHQGEWGVMMDVEERLINKLLSDCKCYIICTAHPEGERNELTGISEYMPALLGRKLAPKVPRMFSDVVLSWKDGREFYWSTIKAMYRLKARNLPLEDKLPPDYKKVVDHYQSRVNATRSIAMAEPEAEAKEEPTPK